MIIRCRDIVLVYKVYFLYLFLTIRSFFGLKDVTKSRFCTDINQFISHSDSTCLHMNQLESVYFKVFTDVLLCAGSHSVLYQKRCGN